MNADFHIFRSLEIDIYFFKSSQQFMRAKGEPTITYFSDIMSIIPRGSDIIPIQEIITPSSGIDNKSIPLYHQYMRCIHTINQFAQHDAVVVFNALKGGDCDPSNSFRNSDAARTVVWSQKQCLSKIDKLHAATHRRQSQRHAPSIDTTESDIGQVQWVRLSQASPLQDNLEIDARQGRIWPAYSVVNPAGLQHEEPTYSRRSWLGWQAYRFATRRQFWLLAIRLRGA